MKKRLKIKNILILINILFLLGCCIFYGSRMIHYYRIENPKIEDVKTLVELVTLGKNLTDNGDGLYHENDIYYYKDTVNGSSNCYQLLEFSVTALSLFAN